MPRLPQRQKRNLLMAVGVIIICTSTAALVLAGYWLGWNWTGFPEKTLWDWMQLLIVPGVLAIGAFLFNLATSRNEQKIAHRRDQTEHEIALDNQREALLQAYLDRMAELLLNNHLRESDPYSEVRYIARARTLTVLPRLDAHRKRSLLQFLHESDLLSNERGTSIIHLNGADLSGAYLKGANLTRADLGGADLSEADLRDAHLTGTELGEANLTKAQINGASLIKANLSRANLRGADLSGADLSGADLFRTDLREANLSEAIVTKEQILKAKTM
jgi:uncharacterized protein YjbI with pentapeptide repeats